MLPPRASSFSKEKRSRSTEHYPSDEKQEGKPGGVSIGEKSPLLFNARPQFLQEKVACEAAAQGSLFAGRTAARLFQSLIRYLERPLRTASTDVSAFVRSCRRLLPGGAAMRPAQERKLRMSASDDRHRRAGARVSVAFAYPSGQRCAGRSDGALRQPFSPLSSRCSGAGLRPVWP